MKTFQVMISLPILLLAVIACAQQVTGEEQRETSLYSNGRSREHPKLLAAHVTNDGKLLKDAVTDTNIKKIEKHEAHYQQEHSPEVTKNYLPPGNETKRNQENKCAKPTPRTNTQISKENPLRASEEKLKVEIKQMPKPVTQTRTQIVPSKVDKFEGDNKNKDHGKETATASPNDNKDDDSGTTTTEDDRINGTLLISMGGPP